MAENFAAFDYKTQEEVLLVVKSLTNVLSTTGMQCIEALSPRYLLAQLQAPTGQQPLRTQTNGTEASVHDATTTADPAEQVPTAPTLEKLPLLRTSVLIALIMLLKVHLKNLYGLTEEKCLKWVMGKKNALGDKPATRRGGAAAAPLSWARLPFATQPLLTTADMAAQRDAFLEIWHEDGVTAEPEDDFS
jgi:cohesin loading factor subunit SCC2